MESPLQPEEFAAIYSEIVIQSTDSTSVDSVDYVDRVLQEFEVSRVEYEESMKHFESKPELWLETFSRVEELLKERSDQSKKAVPPRP